MNFEPDATLSADNMRMGYGKTYKGATSIEKMYNSDEEHKVLDNLPPLHIDFAACDTLELIQATNPEVALIKRNLNPKQYLEASKQEIIKALEEGRYQKNSIELLYLLSRVNKTDIDDYLGNDIDQIPEKYREIFMSAALYTTNKKGDKKEDEKVNKKVNKKDYFSRQRICYKGIQI